MKRFVLTALCLFAIAACDKPSTPEPKADDPTSKNTTSTTNAAATAATTATTAQPAMATINDADLATPADFEEAAEKAITTKNYKAELATLEADIAKE